MLNLILILLLTLSSIALAENGLTPLGQKRMDTLINGSPVERIKAAREFQSIITRDVKKQMVITLKSKFEDMNKSMPQQLDEFTIALGALVTNDLVLIMYQITIPDSQLTTTEKKQLKDYLYTQFINQVCTDEGQLYGVLAGMKFRRTYSTISGSKLFDVEVSLENCINR